MKRKIEPDKDDDEQRRKQSLRERTVGFNVQDSGLTTQDDGFPQGLLTFTWADKNSSEIKLPSYENKELEARFEKHKDSYIHETTYFFLKSTKTPVPNPTGLQLDGKKLDEMIVNLLKEEVQSMYDKKWRQFFIKNSNTASSSSGESSLLNRFGATLSKKQLPTGVVPLVKQKIELMLHNNEVEGMSGGDIPKSAMWLYNKIQHFKEQNLINIHDLANNFLERVEHNTKIIITVGKTLKSVINSKFDYDIPRERLDMLQTTCRKSIAGLSKAIETLIEILFSGKVGQDNSATTYDIIELDDIDFNNQNIGKGEQDIALLSNITLKSLEEADLFSYAGFWTIMSKYAINANMNETDAFNFTTTPALASASRSKSGGDFAA
ncbi:uncharacterized protein EV154DRAFT_605614 [Mucor mucedo]|uniref:uncharacterized protein n=1 Tax=Mucor mucedo TaxID=29922 RepID=UPI00221EF234|nr:uncharacterized protein EV154DRAFT_605614 [Mucor mucedo]KAI7886892.1 hypothetical protein EV154DRAFT_605614 [Mucor mucedo]